MRGRRISVGQVLVDQEERKRIVAIESVTEAAAAFVEIGEQPTFAVNVLNVFDRRFEREIIVSGTRRDALADEGEDAIDHAPLISSKAKVHVTKDALKKIGNGAGRSLSAIARSAL